MILGFGNNVKGAIAADISANQTAIPVMPGTGALFASTLVPDASLANSSLSPQIYAKVTLTDERETIFEICHLLSVSGDTLNVLRGQEGTAARSWYIGNQIANFATRGSENLFVQVEELQNGKYTACIAGGTKNALTADIPATFFDAGSTGGINLRTPLYIIPVSTNTGPATILMMMSGQVVGTYPLVKGDNQPLKAGDIVSRLPLLIVFNVQASNFQVVNPALGVLDEAEADTLYLRIDNNLSEIADNGPEAQQQAREHIDVVDGTTQKKGLVKLTDLSKPEDEGSSSLALTPAGLKKVADSITPLTVPVGGGMLWYTDTPPDGWLEGNGQAFDPDENPKLLAVYPDGRVPDCRGYLIRGWDHGAGVDPDVGREIGSIQQDAMQNITGSFPADTREAGSAGTYTTGAFSETRLSKGSGEDGSNRGRLFTFDASRVVRTASETRGKNIATMIIFKTDKASADPGESAPTAIVVTPQGAAINAGSQLQFTATVLPSSIAGDYPVSWAVSDSSLGSIDSTGLYVAEQDRSGSQVVIASVRTGLTVTTPLTQYIAATSITIAPVPDITVGETYHTAITILPPTASEPLLYTSGNNDIASFSGGVVSGQGEGMAIITATGQYSGVAGSQTVTVTPAIVEEEYLKIDNNLSEIAENGPEAQQQARENIGAVGLLKRVVTITSSGNYVPGEDTRFVIFEAVGAGGGFPMTDAPAVGAKVLSGAGAGAYTKTLTQVPESRLFSVFIGATDASGNGGTTRVTSVRGAALYAQGGSPGLPFTSEDPENYPAQREGGEGGGTILMEDDPLTSVFIKKGGNAGDAAIYKLNTPYAPIHVTGIGGSSELGVGGYSTGSGKGPGYGGGAAGFVMVPGNPGRSYPGGNGQVIAWEYA
ncbi:TPA: Ig-like domain-containing protein [Enterobacter kobei]|nr:Ig-like domain-containing protein [Enterobacter kobei]